jgi:hypothetical protein
MIVGPLLLVRWSTLDCMQKGQTHARGVVGCIGKTIPRLVPLVSALGRSSAASSDMRKWSEKGIGRGPTQFLVVLAVSLMAPYRATSNHWHVS